MAKKQNPKGKQANMTGAQKKAAHQISNQQKDQFEQWAQQEASRRAVPIMRTMEQARPIEKRDLFVVAAKTLVNHACPILLETSVDNFPKKVQDLLKDIDKDSDHIECETVYCLNELLKNIPFNAFGFLADWDDAVELLRPLINQMANIHTTETNKLIDQMYSEQPQMRKNVIEKP